MSWFRMIVARVHALFGRRKLDRELDDEVSAHIDLLVQANIRGGMRPAEARYAAKREFGGVEQTKETYRDRRGIPMLETLLQDLRYAFRALVKNRGFTFVAVLTLGIGIGANTAIFSIVNQVLLRPLPYPRPGELVQIWNTYMPQWPQLGVSGGDFADWKTCLQSFSQIGVYRDVSLGVNLTGDGDPERLEASYASSGLFSMLGVQPSAGRIFLESEDQPGAPPVVLISHRLWQMRFGGNPAAIGKTLTLNGQPYTLAGVLPANFKMPPWADLWLPLGSAEEERTSRRYHPFDVIARVRNSVTLPKAQAEVESLARSLAASYPATNKNFGILMQRLEDPFATRMRPALLVLLAAVGLVLLIACVNIANLLQTRNAARRKEFALRLALGAGRSRIVRQLLTEATLLSILGAAAGILLATLGLAYLRVLIPADLAGVKEAALDGRVFGFTLAVALLTGLVCGFLPALQTWKTDLNGTLKEGERDSSGEIRGRLRRALVISEIALALVPLAAGGLLVKSFLHVLRVDLGFRPDHVLAVQITQPEIPPAELRQMSPIQFAERTERDAARFRELSTRVGTLPGVKAVGGIHVLPLGTNPVSRSRFVIEGRPETAEAPRPTAEMRTVTAGYFSAMGIPLLQGRWLEESDRANSNIVVNETFARHFWPTGGAFGKRVDFCSLGPPSCWNTIVGMVGNVREFGLDAPPTMDVYGLGGWTKFLVIRTASDPLALAAAVRGEAHSFDATLPVSNIVTLEQLRSDSVASRRFSALLLGMFALIALLLGAVGIYGVMAYMVTQRTREMGIRISLGAQTGDILRLVLSEGLRWTALGVAIGLAGALVAARALTSLLFGVAPYDPAIFGGVSALLVVIALAACWFPARRAMRVDPIVALRHE